MKIYQFPLLIFLTTFFNDLITSQSYPSQERSLSFFEDLIDNRRQSKRLLKSSLFRPSLFHVIKFPNDECYDLSNQSGTCYTPFQCKAYGGTGTASCANGYGQCCIISRSCHNATSQKVVYFKNPSYPQMDTVQNFCDLTIEIRDTDVCQLKMDFLDFQMDQPTDGDCLGDKLKITATGLTPSSIPTLCGTNRNQHMFIHLPPENKERSVSLLFETNNNGPYRWHIRITQIDCVHNSYASAFSTFGTKMHNFRMKRSLDYSQSSISNISSINHNNDDKIIVTENESLDRHKRSLFMTEATLRMTVPAPSGCLQYHMNGNGIIESFNFGHYFNNLDYAICIERLPNVCKIIFSCQDTSFGIETNNVGMQINEGAAGDEQCSRDYFMIPGGSTNGDFPTKDRYCGAKLTAIDYNNVNRVLGQQVITRVNGPIVLRFHTDGALLSKIRQGFRIKFEQSAENCQSPNMNYNQGFTGYSASSAVPFNTLNTDRLNGISPTILALKQEKFNVIKKK